MKKLFLAILLIFSISTFTEASGRKDPKTIFTSSSSYEIVPIEVGTEGTKYVKVWATAKKVEDAIIEARRLAVAAAIFGGIPGSGNRIQATPALCSDSNAYMDNKSYFDNFFYLGSEFLGYAVQTSDGVPSGVDRLKVKGGYKVGIKVQIMHSNLRKKLEKDGIIRALNYGF